MLPRCPHQENLATRYRGPRVPGNAHRRAVSASFNFSEAESIREPVNGRNVGVMGHEAPGPSQKRRGSGEWQHLSSGPALGAEDDDSCHQVGTPSGLRNGVLLQHRFCPWDGTPAHTYLHVHAYIHMHAYIHAYINTHTQIHTYTHTRARAHTHTHTHTRRSCSGHVPSVYEGWGEMTANPKP